MKLGQLIEYKKKNIFLQKFEENKARREVPDLFLFLKNVQYEVKASGVQLSFNIFQ